MPSCRGTQRCEETALSLPSRFLAVLAVGDQMEDAPQKIGLEIGVGAGWFSQGLV